MLGAFKAGVMGAAGAGGGGLEGVAFHPLDDNTSSYACAITANNATIVGTAPTNVSSPTKGYSHAVELAPASTNIEARHTTVAETLVTAHCWVRPKGSPGGAGMTLRKASDNNVAYSCYWDATTAFLYTPSGGNIASLGGAIVADTWVHLCLMITGGTAYAFADGVLVGSTSALTYSTNLFGAVGYRHGSGYGNNMYAQALQVHDDAYFSTSGFTPPNPPY